MADTAPLLEYAPRRLKTWHNRFAQYSVVCAALSVAAILVDSTRPRVEERLELLRWQRECLTYSAQRRETAASKPDPECWKRFCSGVSSGCDGRPLYLNERRTTSGRRRLVAVVHALRGCGMDPPRFDILVFEPGTVFSQPRVTHSAMVEGYALWKQDLWSQGSRLTASSDPVDPARFTLALDTLDGQSWVINGRVRDDETVTFAPGPPVATSASGAPPAPSS